MEEENFVPPSDAVLVKPKSNKFVPPSDAILKKKEVSKPTVQKKPLESPTKQKPTATSLATGQAPKQQDSDGLGGAPDLNSRKIQLQKELSTVKVTEANQDEISRKTDELSAIIKEQERLSNVRLSRIEQQFKAAKNEGAAIQEADKRLNDLLTTTGVWNNIKSASIGIYNKVVDEVSALADDVGIKEFKADVDPLSKEKKEVKQKALKQKVKLTESQLTEQAKQLYKDKQIDYIETDNINSFLDNLDEEDRLSLKQLKSKQAVHLQEDNIKQEKIINAYEVVGSKKIKEYNDLEKQLLDYKKTNQQFPKDLYESYLSLGEEIKGISDTIVKKQEAIQNNKADLGTVEQEFDFLKRQYGDVENFILNTGTMARKLGVNIVSGLDYIGTLGGVIGDKEKNKGVQRDIIEISDSIDEERSNLRKSVESVESAEGFVNYVSDLVSNQLPNLAATAFGAKGLAVIGAAGAGEKYAEMNKEVMEGKATYSPLQMASAPLLYGGAEVISEIPTLSILKKGGRLLESISKNEADLISKSAKEKAKEWAKDWAIDTSKETTGEEFTNFAQNFTDKYVLGKKNVGLLDNAGTVFKDAVTLTSVLKAAPHVAGVVLKAHQSNEDLVSLDENSKKIIEFTNQLDSNVLSDAEKSVVTKQMNKLVAKNSEIIANTIDKVDNMPVDVYKKVIDLNNKAADIKTEAQVINDGNLPNKKELLKELGDEYKLIRDERANLINAEYKNESPLQEAFDKLEDNEKIKLKDEASRVLMEEAKSRGLKEFEFSDKTITDKAVELFKQSETEVITPVEEVVTEEVVAPTEEVVAEEVKPEVVTEEVVSVKEEPVIKSSKNNKYDIYFNENGGVDKIVTKKGGKEINKFIEYKDKKGNAKIKRNAGYTQIEAEALGVITSNKSVVEQKQIFQKALDKFTPTNEYEAALDALARGAKVSNPRQETGDKAKWVTDKKAKSIETLSEDIWMNYPDLELDQQEVRDQLIDIINTYGSLSDVRNQLVNTVSEESERLSQQETYEFLNSLSEKERAMYEDMKAEDDYISELSDEDAIKYYEQQYEEQTDKVADVEGIGAKEISREEEIKPVAETAKEMVAVSEFELLKSKIRDAVKEAKLDVDKKRKEIADSINELYKKGKITTYQAKVIANKALTLNLNSKKAVDSFIAMMDKVYQNAQYAESIIKSNSLRKNAAKNIKSKIGTSKYSYPVFNKLFSINSKLIPDNVMDKYLDIVNQFGQRKAVLSTMDLSEATNIANEILNEIEKELDLIPSLQLTFEMSDNKVLNEEGDIDLSKTLDNMIKANEIDQDDANLIKKYKSQILPPKVSEAKSTKEEEDKLKKDISSTTYNVSELPNIDERKAAKRLIDSIKDKNVLDSMNVQMLRTLSSVLENINSGYFSNNGLKLLTLINSYKATKLLAPKIKGVKQMIISKYYNSLKGLVFGRTGVLENIRSNPLYDIDTVLGNIKGSQIYDNTFGKIGKAYAKFRSEVDSVNEKLTQANNILEKYFSGKTNEIVISKYKMTAYLLQKEYESNEGSKGIAPAKDFIEATIDLINKRTTALSKRDARYLQDIIDNYSTDGNIDLNKVYNSFSAQEKKALSIIEDVNSSLSEAALYTGSIIRGVRVDMLNNYVHHNVMRDSSKNKKEESVNISNKYDKFTSPNTKAGTLVERTSGAKALNFDPISSAMIGANETLMDYNLTEDIRTVIKTIQNLKSEILNDPDSTDNQKDAVNALDDAFDEVLRMVFENEMKVGDIKFLETLEKLGYQAALASVPRAVAEFASNFGYVVMVNPIAWTKGMTYSAGENNFIVGNSGREVMSTLKSESTGKLFGKTTTGKMSDVGLFGAKDLKNSNKAVNDVNEAYNIIKRYNPAGKNLSDVVSFISDNLVSTPDKAISRPLWFGTFDIEFKKASGKDIDWNKIKSQDEDYLNENQEAIDKAVKLADLEVTRAATSVNPFNKILKSSVKVNDSMTMAIFKRVNGFMANFTIYEYTTARTAILSLIGNGDVTKRKGLGMLAGITFRMTAYGVVYSYLSTIMASMLGYGDDDEEDYKEKTKRALVGTAATLILGRNLGNVAKIPLNFGLEMVNDRYLEDLRNGKKYDPYKHSIVFSQINEEALITKNPFELMAITLSGPYGPAVKTVARISKLGVNAMYGKPKTKEAAINELENRMILEVLGNYGKVPFYKDIRRILVKEMFKEEKETTGRESSGSRSESVSRESSGSRSQSGSRTSY